MLLTAIRRPRVNEGGNSRLNPFSRRFIIFIRGSANFRSIFECGFQTSQGGYIITII